MVVIFVTVVYVALIKLKYKSSRRNVHKPFAQIAQIDRLTIRFQYLFNKRDLRPLSFMIY